MISDWEIWYFPDIAKEWRLLGQEQNGILLFTWIQEGKNTKPRSRIGLYRSTTNTLETIYSFDKPVNIIQASINLSKNLLGYVTKESTKTDSEQDQFVYKPFLLKFSVENPVICDLNLSRSKQIMVQFLYNKQSVLSDKQPDKFLIFIHQECKY